MLTPFAHANFAASINHRLLPVLLPGICIVLTILLRVNKVYRYQLSSDTTRIFIYILILLKFSIYYIIT